MSRTMRHVWDCDYISEIFTLIRPFVRPFVSGVSEHELCDPRALFEFDWVVDLQ